MSGRGIGSIQTWVAIHKWTSLVSTIFLLILCITGLPLIFHGEIDDWLSPRPAMKSVPQGTPPVTLDAIVAASLAKHPGDVPVSLTFIRGRSAVVVQTAPTPKAAARDTHRATIDLRTGEPSDQRAPSRGAFTSFLKTLHTELFLGEGGMLFLGLVALAFIASVVSGIVVYVPFMRRLAFGTIRFERSQPLRWLDLHNLLGIAIALWLLMVGVTGLANSLHDTVVGQMRAEMTAMGKRHDGPPTKQLASVDAVVAAARAALPDGALASLFFPGAGFSSPHDFAALARGDKPITSEVSYAALIDAQSGQVSDVLKLPFYAKLVLMSQPLHFGNYGGLPLKILWLLLDTVAIVVLGSGLYLWIRKHRDRSVRVKPNLAGAQS